MMGHLQNGNESQQNTYEEQHDQIVLQPYKYIAQIPGKQVRGKIFLAFNYWLNVPLDKLKLIGSIVESLRTSSLLIDDIQDNSTVRRGMPVAHSIYSVGGTMCAAHHAIFLALKKMTSIGHPEAATLLAEQLVEVNRGQGIEIYWRDNCLCPTEEQYRLMAIQKSAGPFKLATGLMQLFSETQLDLNKLNEIMGLYYQIRNDYLNFSHGADSDTSNFCEDLAEGKFAFPLVHAIQTHPEDNNVLRILRQRTRDRKVKEYCVSLLEDFGSMEYTRNVLEKLDQQARVEAKKLGNNPLIEEALDELLTWKNYGSTLKEVH